MKLYRSFREEVPEEEYTIDIGKANVKKEGNDITLIAYGAMVQESIKAAEELEKMDTLSKLLTYVQFNQLILIL